MTQKLYVDNTWSCATLAVTIGLASHWPTSTSTGLIINDRSLCTVFRGIVSIVRHSHSLLTVIEGAQKIQDLTWTDQVEWMVNDGYDTDGLNRMSGHWRIRLLRTKIEGLENVLCLYKFSQIQRSEKCLHVIKCFLAQKPLESNYTATYFAASKTHAVAYDSWALVKQQKTE